MWLYKGKAERPKGRHSKCVDCFAIKFRLVEDGFRQTEERSIIAPNWERESYSGHADLNPHRAPPVTRDLRKTYA